VDENESSQRRGENPKLKSRLLFLRHVLSFGFADFSFLFAPDREVRLLQNIKFDRVSSARLHLHVRATLKLMVEPAQT